MASPNRDLMPKFNLPKRAPSKLQCKLLEMTWDMGFLSTQDAIEHIYQIEHSHDNAETWRYATNSEAISARSSIIKSAKRMMKKGWIEKPCLDRYYRLTPLGRAVYLDIKERGLIPNKYYRQNYFKYVK